MSSQVVSTDPLRHLPVPTTDFQRKHITSEQHVTTEQSYGHPCATNCAERSSSIYSEDCRSCLAAESEPGDWTRTVMEHDGVAPASEVGRQSRKPPLCVQSSSTSSDSTHLQLPERQRLPSPQPSQSRMTMHRKRSYSECFSEEHVVQNEATSPTPSRKVVRGSASAADCCNDDGPGPEGCDDDSDGDNRLLTPVFEKAHALSRAVAEELCRRKELEAELAAVRLRVEELQYQAEQARCEAEQARSHVELLRSEAEQLRSDVDQARSSAEQARCDADLARKEAMDGFAEILDKELQCIICCDLIIQAKSLGCSHTFCSYCIDTWLLKNVNCPSCRQPVKSSARCCAIDNCIEKAVEQMSEEKQALRRVQVEERKGEQDRAARNDSSDQQHLPASTSAAGLQATRSTIGSFGFIRYSVEPSSLPGARGQEAAEAASTDGSRQRVRIRISREAVSSTSSTAVMNDATNSSAPPRRSMRLQSRGQQPTGLPSEITSNIVLIASSDEEEGETGSQRSQVRVQPDGPQSIAVQDGLAEFRQQQMAVSSGGASDDEQPLAFGVGTSDQVDVEEGSGHRNNDDSGSDLESSIVTEVVDHNVEQGAILFFDELEPFEEDEHAEDASGEESEDSLSDDGYDQHYSRAVVDTSQSRGSRYHVRGLPGSYYGGYGYCYSCGCRGHWAHGCPYR